MIRPFHCSLPGNRIRPGTRNDRSPRAIRRLAPAGRESSPERDYGNFTTEWVPFPTALPVSTLANIPGATSSSGGPGQLSRTVRSCTVPELAVPVPFSASVALQVQTGDPLKVSIPRNKHARSLPNDRRDEEVEVAHGLSSPVALPAEAGRLLRRIGIQW